MQPATAPPPDSNPPSASPLNAGGERPDLVTAAAPLLSPMERLQLALVRRTFEPGRFEDGLKWMQRRFGSSWIRLVTDNLHHVHHEDRLPKVAAHDSIILVCNHRSFFDLYLVTAHLVHRGLQQRLVFPVRSEFFYDNPLGLAINGCMSFFAMYPPVFRDRKKAAFNTLTLDELAWLLRSGGHFVGFHPEGTRNQGDPYTLLPARTGIGRLVHSASSSNASSNSASASADGTQDAKPPRVLVIPVFTNGLLSSDLVKQVRGNFDGTGVPIHTVFGAPIDFGDLLTQPASQSVYKRIANCTRQALVKLAEEERTFRAQSAGHGRSGPRGATRSNESPTQSS